MNPVNLCDKLGIQFTPTMSFEEYVAQWSKLAEAVKALAKHELAIRKSIAASAFPAPKEGANTFDMAATGQTLAMTHKINRSVDESLFEAVRAEYDLLNDRPVNFDELFKMKPSLVTSEYRKLVPDTPAYKTASRCLIAKPGAPSLEIR